MGSIKQKNRKKISETCQSAKTKVIINTNLGATFRYLNPNNSAMSLIVTSLLQFLLCIKIADLLVFGLEELARR